MESKTKTSSAGRFPVILKRQFVVLMSHTCLQYVVDRLSFQQLSFMKFKHKVSPWCSTFHKDFLWLHICFFIKTKNYLLDQKFLYLWFFSSSSTNTDSEHRGDLRDGLGHVTLSGTNICFSSSVFFLHGEQKYFQSLLMPAEFHCNRTAVNVTSQFTCWS